MYTRKKLLKFFRKTSLEELGFRERGHQISSLSQPTQQIDMGEAPHAEYFYGRENELATVKRWIVDEHCRLVSIIGMGGIGKTSLIARLIDKELSTFSAVFWRSLLNAPPFEQILQRCLQFLTWKQQVVIPQDLEEQIRLLLAQLREKRCLLILDNVEAILKSGSSTGEYKEGYEGYGRLFRLLGESRHQSCLVLTSREQPKEIAWLWGKGMSVQTYRLGGLKVEDARVIFQKRGLSGEENSWKALVERFSGNPMMLIIVSPAIRESYQGLISRYLVEVGDISLNEYPDLRALLDRQFERLSWLEQQVIYWLAIEREAISLQDLYEIIVPDVSKGSILVALEALQRRSWIEQSESGRFMLQPAMMDVITERFNDLIVQEIRTDKFELFASHALLKAQAKAYIRESQLQLILKVIAQNLFNTLSRKELEEKFRQRLATLRKQAQQQDTYEAGNILNLLAQTNSNLRGFNFSRLAVRQAYLQGVDLPDVDFSYVNLTRCVFTDTFGSILSVALSSDGEYLAAGTDDGTIHVWNLKSGAILSVCKGHTDWVRSLAFCPDGSCIASGSEDGTIRLWDVSNGACHKVLQSCTGLIFSVAFSPDGAFLAAGGDNPLIPIWEVRSGDCLRVLQGHSQRIWSVTFSPDGAFIVSGSEDHTLRMWDVTSGNCLKILQGHTNWVRSVAFSSDGAFIAYGGDDSLIHVWNVRNGDRFKLLQGHSNRIWSVAFSPDGTLIASGSDDQTIRLWEVRTGRCLKILQGHTGAITTVAFSPDSSVLASGSEDQTVRLWEMNSGDCVRILPESTSWIWSISFGLEGATIAGAGGDQKIRIWEVNSGRCLRALYEPVSWIYAIAFSPDREVLASGNEKGMIRLWDMQGNLCTKILGDEKPYERMNITGTVGLTDTQKMALKGLGAIEDEENF